MDEAETESADAPKTSTLWGAATDWSLIQRAGGRDGPEERNKAWEELVRRYQRAIEVSVRRRLANRLSGADVENGVASFMGYLFEHGLLARADSARGRFRAYVQGVMNRWVYAYARSVRGSPRSRPIDPDDIDRPVEDDPPELLQSDESEWASDVLANAVAALRVHRPEDVDLLVKDFGIPPERAHTRDEHAEILGISKNALNVRMFHARKRLRELILEELRQLCADDAEWQAEQAVIIGRLTEASPRIFHDDGLDAQPDVGGEEE